MSNHIGDTNKMVSDTPRTNKEAFLPHDSKYRVCDADFARKLERELNAANERIKLLEAVVNDPHALWTNWLRGNVKLPVGIGDVREYQDRINRLEEAGNEMHRYITVTRGLLPECTNDWRKAKEAKL